MTAETPNGNTTDTRKNNRTRAMYWERGPVGTLPFLVGGLGILGIGLAYDIPIRHSIEHKLESAAAHDLGSLGATGARVDFTGRDGVISGTLPPGVSKEEVLNAVASIDGVRTVTFATPAVAAGTPSATAGPGSVASTAGPAVTGSLTSPADATSGSSSNGDGSDSSAPSASTVTTASPTVTTTSNPATPSSPSGTASASTPAASPTPSASGTGTASSSPNKIEVQRQLTALPQITFVNGTTRYTAQGRASVAKAAKILRDNPSIKVRIEGHTDDIGTAAANRELSIQRAETVRQTLWSMGIDHERMSYRGYGEAYPKLANTSAANRAVNRRVIFKVL